MHHSAPLLFHSTSAPAAEQAAIAIPQDTVEITVLIAELISQEFTLRQQADQLEMEAQRLDGAGDEAQLACEQLRAKRSHELAMADDLRHVVAELKENPTARRTRMVASAMGARVQTALSEGEDESEMAHTAHALGEEHHAVVRHHAEAQAKTVKLAAPETKALTKSKPAKKGKVRSVTPAKATVAETVVIEEGALPEASGRAALAPTPVLTVQSWGGIGAQMAAAMHATRYVLSAEVVAAVHCIHIPPNIGPLLHHAADAPLAEQPAALLVPPSGRLLIES